MLVLSRQRDESIIIGDKVVVTGSQITVRGEPFILATTVKRGNEVLRLRDKVGVPEWLGWKRTND